jgi:hypothetical protein
MALQEQDAGGIPPGRQPAITLADRGMWQRQAVAMLEYLVTRHAQLPAITWQLTWVGNLRGCIGDDVPPGEARKAFTAWSAALGLDDHRQLPGTGGLVRAHGRARWGTVAVSVTASVRPTAPGEAAQHAGTEPGKPAVLLTRDVIPAVEFLARTLSIRPDLGAVTWLVRPSGELSARACVPGSALQTGSLFRHWLEALDLPKPQARALHNGAAVGLHVQGYCSGNVHVTLEATLTRTRLGHDASERAVAVRPGDVPTLDRGVSRPRERPRAAAERLAARPLRPAPTRASDRPAPTPRPS